MAGDILSVLKSGAVDQKVALLQKLVKGDGSQIDEETLALVKTLTNDAVILHL